MATYICCQNLLEQLDKSKIVIINISKKAEIYFGFFIGISFLILEQHVFYIIYKQSIV
jgi:hypothetical protein